MTKWDKIETRGEDNEMEGQGDKKEKKGQKKDDRDDTGKYGEKDRKRKGK